MLNAEDLRQLKKIRHVVMDMDGTIYQGKHLFPTTLPFLADLRRLGIGFTFLTNNSSRSRKEYLAHLKSFGIEVRPEQMITSTVSTVDYLRRNHPEIRKLFLLGTETFREEMAECGFLDAAMDEEPDGVVVACDPHMPYERFCKAAWWIDRGKTWICTHPDRKCPTDKALIFVDCGSLAAALTAATGRTPVVPGKPNRIMMESILAANGVSAEETLMCGDLMYTDIQLGVNSGVATVLISPEKAENIPGNIATWTVPDLGVLGGWLKQANGL